MMFRFPLYVMSPCGSNSISRPPFFLSFRGIGLVLQFVFVSPQFLLSHQRI